MYFNVIGNINRYRIHAKDLYDAWKCALIELKYGITGNTSIKTVKEVYRG